MSEAIKVGDRVQLNPEKADEFQQPWPARIRRGLVGTVLHDWGHRLVVRWDCPARAKNPNHWVLQVDPRDLIKVTQ